MSLKNKLFKEVLKNVLSSSSASQHEGPIAQAQLLDPTQPMGQPNPWTTLAR